MNNNIWSRADGSVYRNLGPVNPVIDIEAAHSMAIASNYALTERARALELIGGADPLTLSNRKLGRLASMNPTELAIEQDKAEERVRSSIGSRDIVRGKVLFNLVELSPPSVK